MYTFVTLLVLAAVSQIAAFRPIQTRMRSAKPTHMISIEAVVEHSVNTASTLSQFSQLVAAEQDFGGYFFAPFSLKHVALSRRCKL